MWIQFDPGAGSTFTNGAFLQRSYSHTAADASAVDLEDSAALILSRFLLTHLQTVMTSSEAGDSES